MATGPEHYREAERLLVGTPVTAADVEEGIGPPSGIWPASDYEVSCAHVHAVLALAAAVGTMGSLEDGGATRSPADDRAWRAAAGDPR